MIRLRILLIWIPITATAAARSSLTVACANGIAGTDRMAGADSVTCTNIAFHFPAPFGRPFRALLADRVTRTNDVADTFITDHIDGEIRLVTAVDRAGESRQTERAREILYKISSFGRFFGAENGGFVVICFLSVMLARAGLFPGTGIFCRILFHYLPSTFFIVNENGTIKKHRFGLVCHHPDVFSTGNRFFPAVT